MMKRNPVGMSVPEKYPEETCCEEKMREEHAFTIQRAFGNLSYEIDLLDKLVAQCRGGDQEAEDNDHLIAPTVENIMKDSPRVLSELGQRINNAIEELRDILF